MNQIEVQIMGQSYRLGCPPDGEARLLQAVARVDEAMCRIRDAGKVKARDRIAVLAALNLAFDLVDPARNSAADAGAAQPAAPTSDASAPAAPAADPDDTARIAHMLARLDQALAHDGRLL